MTPGGIASIRYLVTEMVAKKKRGGAGNTSRLDRVIGRKSLKQHSLYLSRHVSVLKLDLGASIESLVHTLLQCPCYPKSFRSRSKRKILVITL